MPHCFLETLTIIIVEGTIWPVELRLIETFVRQTTSRNFNGRYDVFSILQYNASDYT